MFKSILLTNCFLILSFFGIFCETTKNVLIEGTVTDLKGKAISLYLFDPTVPNVDPDTKIIPVDNGSFSLEFEIVQPVYATLSVDGQNFPLHLEPGDQLELTINSEKFTETLHFKGKGSANNNYLQKFKNKFYPKYFNFSAFIKDKDASEFKEYFSQQRKEQTAFFHLEEKKLSPGFRKKAIGAIESYYAANILKYPGFYYPGLWKSFNGLPENLPEDFYKETKNIRIHNDDLLPTATYREFITAFVEYNFKKKKVQVTDYNMENEYQDKLSIINENFEGLTRDYLSALYLKNIVKIETLDQAIVGFNELNSNVTNKAVLTPVEKSIKKLQSLLPGKPAPFFELKDLNGNKVALTDFQGKVIYIDFWASWCVPCLAEVPAAEKLKEHYKNNEVIFLYISLDDKEEDWRNIIKSQDLKGLHILSQGWKSDIADKYNINSIPNYYIIGRNGNIANPNAPRPSDEGIIDEIDKVLGIAVNN